MLIFFFQAEDGIRDFCLSRGLGDVYKRQRRNGVKTEDVTYTCRNCGHKVVRRQQSYDENYRGGGGGGPVIFGGGGLFGGSGGGGFSGGSFGGGMGGGGGAGSRF